MDKEQMDKEQMDKEQMDKEQMDKEQMDKEQMDKEQMDKEQMDKDQMDKEQMDKDQMDKEQMDKDQMDKDQMDKDQMDKDQMDKDQMDKDQMDKDQMGKEQYTFSNKNDIGHSEIYRVTNLLRLLAFDNNSNLTSSMKMLSTNNVNNGFEVTIVLNENSKLLKTTFFLQRSKMDVLCQEIKDNFPTSSKDGIIPNTILEKLKQNNFTIVQHADGENYLRFNAMQLNEITQLTKSRYPDLKIHIDKNYIKFYIPYFFIYGSD
jgi:pentapeptide MXKDX repeat protein